MVVDVVLTSILTVAAVILVLVAVFHRKIPRDWLVERRLSRLPSTPAILDRVVDARREQALWSAACGLVCLGIGVVIELIGSASGMPERWHLAVSLLYFIILGFIAGSVINLARNGYAFADRNGPRVAQARRRSILSLVGIWSLVTSHLCVAITIVVALSLVFMPGDRAIERIPDFIGPADIVALCILSVIVLVICDVVTVWINRMPSSAGNDLELVWDGAVKATTAQRLLSYAPVISGYAALMLCITSSAQLGTPRVVALVIAYVLWYADTFIPSHLPTKPKPKPKPLADEQVHG